MSAAEEFHLYYTVSHTIHILTNLHDQSETQKVDVWVKVFIKN